ncbi:MAG: M56 family metallopeptidase [Christensenellales bacterium]
MSISLGPFLTCFVTILILTVYAYVMMKRSNDFFRGTVKIIFAIIAVIMLRMMVPVNFPFTRTIYSSKLLIGLGNIVYANVYGDREILVSDLLLWLWIGVAVILLIRYFYKRVKVRRILEQYVIKDTDTKEYYESFLNDTKIRSIKIAVIPGERQAAIFGVIRPIMILPDAVLEEKTVAHMIRHEIKHYANYDLWLKFFVDLLVVIHWWNPIVYMMRKELSLAFELSNDYMVTKDMSELGKIEYAETLVQAAKLMSNQQAYDLNLTGGECLETRIKMLLKEKTTEGMRSRLLAAANLLFVFLIMIISLVFVPEVFYKESVHYDSEEFEGSFEITPGNAYYLKTENGYELYVDDVYRWEIEELPEDYEESGVPIYEKK